MTRLYATASSDSRFSSPDTLAIIYNSIKQSYESTRADWLKIVFVKLDGDTELAWAVDVVMTWAKILNFW